MSATVLQGDSLFERLFATAGLVAIGLLLGGRTVVGLIAGQVSLKIPLRGNHRKGCRGTMGNHCVAGFLKAICGLFCLASLLLQSGKAAELRPNLSMDFGVQTHFSQGWNQDLLERARGLGSNSIRDALPWERVEASPGEYNFANGGDQYITRATDMGISPLLVFADSNQLYDEGQTPFTDEGRRAFAKYIVEALRAYSRDIGMIEVGNEFNASNFISGPFAEDPTRYFALLLEEVYKQVKFSFPDTVILCSGAHSVPIGYFRKLFENGALEYCDAISIHPYRPFPEHVDIEISRLQTLMDEFGGEKPIFVTEFSKWFDDPAEAPDFMLKMISLLGNAGVAGAYWYALVDQQWWPNMGLIDGAGKEKPAAAAYRFIQNSLLPLGRPVSRSQSNLDHIYEFGDSQQAFVAWGAPAALNVEGAARYFNAKGEEIAPVSILSDDPVVILGNNLRISTVRTNFVADPFYQYASKPWSYFALGPNGSYSALTMIDWEWSSFIGHKYLKPLSINASEVAGIMSDDGPIYAVERFSAEMPGTYEIHGRWTREKDGGDGADVRILHNGQVVAAGIVDHGSFEFGPVQIRLEESDTLDFAVGPNKEFGGDLLARRIKIKGP